MLYLFFFIIFSICSDELSLVVTENDPSTLVEGVSVITGDLYVFEEDYVVQGAEPIRIRRSFLSREGVYRDYLHLTATFQCAINRFIVNEPNGTAVCYYADPQNSVFSIIGDRFYGEKNRKPLKYKAFSENDKGLANTKTGDISARTNLKNQTILFDPAQDANGKSFTLYAADGTARRYINQTGQQKTKGPYGESYLAYYYNLVSETLPDGHMIHYQWDHKNRLNRIFTTNLSQTKTFASINIPVSDSVDPPTTLTLNGSDQRSATYKAHPTEVKHLFVQSELISPDLPDQSFGWDMKPRKFRDTQTKMPYLQLLCLKQQRTMQIGYTDVEDPVARQKKIDERLKTLRSQIQELKPKAKKKPTTYKQKLDHLLAEEKLILKHGIENEGVYEGYKVKTISSPVGKDASLIATHSFFYDKDNKHTYVLDAKNNKTDYFWNDDYRLTRIDRYIGSLEFHSADSFLWENSRLKCKTYYNQSRTPIFCRTYLYDDRGNVKEETFYGDLSGRGSPLKIGSNGLPEENGVEKSIRKMTYSDNGRNLLIKQEEPSTGYCIKYTHRNDCHLPKTKAICDQENAKIQTTYEYDNDLILNSETTEDGISHIIKSITPYQNGPYVGMAQTLEERDKTGALLRKTVLNYGPGACITQKDVYDANNQKRYSIKMGYDSKGRLTSETNAIGQEAIYRYDDIGNRNYVRDFSGRLETFYDYDFSNRLIQKEEKGDDGIHRIYQYEYDTKSHLISETDPFENKTTYVPDAFGNRKEIHFPPILNENGESATVAVKYEYDSAGNQAKKQDAEGNITQTSYNAYGKPILIIHPDGSEEKFIYYLDGSLKDHTDPKDVVTSYEYDYLKRVVKKTISNAEETFEYTGMYLTRKIDAEKNETTYKYDLSGRRTSEECTGEETKYTYDEFGRARTTQRGDLITITEYDLLDRVIEERNESISKEVLRKVQYEYDIAGNKKTIIRFINGKEAKEALKYDSLGRLIERKDPLGFTETVQYHPKINQKTHTDPMGLETIETHNSQNKIASILKKKNEKTLSLAKKYYDKNGELSLQIDTVYDPDGNKREVKTVWEYNSRGLLKTLTEAEGTVDAKITRYTYTPRGELETVTKPDGVVLTYQYNDLGHLESLISSDGSVNHQMKYSRLGHLQESDSLIRKTDPFGRILKEKFPHWHTIENTYDKRGRRKTCKISAAGCLISYEYDAAHLKQVTRKKLDGTDLYSHAYTQYDQSGNVLEEEMIHGAGTVQYSIDPLNRKAAIRAPLFTQEVLAFDGIGNIQKMQIGADEISYTYDNLYQLTSESGLFAHNYAFDSLNNRLRKDSEKYEINPLNQIASHFKYDKNGNPIQNGDTIYSYDALNRLIQIETPEFVQAFTYDTFHRCLSKSTTRSGNTKTLYFLYDGQNEIGALDESAAPLELRILGNTPHAEIDAAIAIELNGKVHIPIHDLQGNLAALQPIGSEPTLYRYSAFGEEKITGQAISPWRFSSKRTDHQTHLVSFGRRYYLPSFGRWLTPDPAGFTDGMNLYAYVHNAPLTHFDEYGLMMTASDYRTTQQIANASWEGDRPWSTISHYGRNLASRMVHDVYDYYAEPLIREFDRTTNLFSQGLRNTEQTIWGQRQGIDHLFRTNFANTDRVQSQFRMEFAQTGIPFGPAGLLSGAGKASTAVGRLFQNTGALSPARKLSSDKINKSFHWNPITGPGPIRADHAATFRSATYLQHDLQESTILYRVYSDPSKAIGKYWTRLPPSGPLQSIMDYALKRSWGNQATNIIKIRVPSGTTVFEGIVTPQEGFLGGGNQIFIQKIEESWIVK